MSESPEDRYEPRPPLPAFPGEVRVAGVLWMLIGTLAVTATCLGTFASVLVQARQPGPARPNPTEGCTAWLGIALGVGFFVAGLRVTRGSARGVLTTSIVSILIGLFYITFGVLGFVLSERVGPKAPQGFAFALLLAGLFGTVFGCAFLLPAALALAGRSRYRRWWEAANAPRRRRRRRPPPREGDRPEGPLLSDLSKDVRYTQAVLIVYRLVNELQASRTEPPDPEDIRSAFESGVAHLVAEGVAEDEARVNLRRLIAADKGASLLP